MLITSKNLLFIIIYRNYGLLLIGISIKFLEFTLFRVIMEQIIIITCSKHKICTSGHSCNTESKEKLSVTQATVEYSIVYKIFEKLSAKLRLIIPVIFLSLILPLFHILILKLSSLLLRYYVVQCLLLRSPLRRTLIIWIS